MKVHRYKYLSVFAVSLAALALGLAACGGSDSGGSGATGGDTNSASSSGKKLSGTIPITSVLDLTGQVAYVGKEEQKGMQLAVADVNSSGILGDAKKPG